jgi:hypothetical protein
MRAYYFTEYFSGSAITEFVRRYESTLATLGYGSIVERFR